MKIIFVSGGVISGLGKGITASSIGCLLKSRGLRVTSVKIDPYLNTDAGTMNPYEHGEVFVLDDGGEVDLDLGNYERFIGRRLGRNSNITTGKVYRTVLDNERRGDYLGKTVQIIPHITDEIKKRITEIAREADVCIVEVGGVVGDIESMPFLEAARQLGAELGDEDVLYVHTTLVPIMGTVGEEKTKPTQHSVHDLMATGIRPDFIVGRCERELSFSARSKIAMFCSVPPEAVVSCPDARSVYEVPLILERQGLADLILDRMKLRPMTTRRDMAAWEGFLSNILEPTSTLKIALVGKYTQLADAYLSQHEALVHACAARKVRLELSYIDSDEIAHDQSVLADADGILVPGGFGTRGTEGMIAAARYAREKGIPYLGVCLGFQIATIEVARDLLGLPKATSTEFDPRTPDPVIDLMPEQEGVEEMGASMRLGAQPVKLAEGSVAARLYGATDIEERHRHRYEVNPAYIDRLEKAGWIFTGRSPDGRRMEVGELKGHPYFVASQFHPEFKSRPLSPSPLHQGLVDAAIAHRDAKSQRNRTGPPSPGDGPGATLFHHVEDSRSMRITYWTDFSCPFCYIGDTRLRKAIASIGAEDVVELDARSFQLTPQAGPVPRHTVAEGMALHYGMSLEEAEERVEGISEMGRAEGLEYDYARSKNCNTFDAHRLSKMALSHGREAAERMNDRLFRAFFGDCELIADHAVLKRLATECGFDADEADEVLSSDRYADQVLADEREAASYGIHAVPFYIIGRYGVPGAVSAQEFADLIEKEMEASGEALPKAPEGAVCGPDGCELPKRRSHPGPSGPGDDVVDGVERDSERHGDPRGRNALGVEPQDLFRLALREADLLRSPLLLLDGGPGLVGAVPPAGVAVGAAVRPLGGGAPLPAALEALAGADALVPHGGAAPGAVPRDAVPPRDPRVSADRAGHDRAGDRPVLSPLVSRHTYIDVTNPR